MQLDNALHEEIKTLCAMAGDEINPMTARANAHPRLTPGRLALVCALTGVLAGPPANAQNYLIGQGGNGGAANNAVGAGTGAGGGGGGIGGGGAAGADPYGGGAGGGIEMGGHFDPAGGYGGSNEGPDGGLGGFQMSPGGTYYIGGRSGVGGGGGGAMHPMGSYMGGGGAALGGGGGASGAPGEAGESGGVIYDVLGAPVSAALPSQGAPTGSNVAWLSSGTRLADYFGVGGGGGGASDAGAGGAGSTGSLTISQGLIQVNRSMLIGGAGGGGQTTHAGGSGGNGRVELLDGATLSVAEHLLIGGSNGGGTIAGTNGGQGGEGRLVMDNAVVNIGPGGRLRLGAGAAGGPGELVLGPGELRFGAGSTFVINTNGYLQIGGTPSAGRPAGTIQGLSVVQNDGHIVFNQTGNARLDAQIVGTGEVRTNRGTTYLTADNTYTGWTWIIAGSTLNLGANGNSGNLAGPVHVGGTLVLERSDASTFSATLNGDGTIRKAGVGTLTLAGAHPFDGNVSADAGVLNVEGSVSSARFTVNNGGTLSGTGVLGATTVLAGGVHAPGNPLGAQTVAGDYKNSGTLRIAATPVAHASLIAQGAVALDNTVLALNLSPNDAASWAPSSAPVVIVDKQSPGAIVGNIGRIENSLLFLDAETDTAGGDGNDLTLRLVPKGGQVPEPEPEPGGQVPEPAPGGTPSINFASLAGSDNQRAVARAAQRLPSSSEVWRALALSTDEGDFQQALAALSGDTYASVNSALLSAGVPAMKRGLDGLRNNLSAGMRPGAATASAGTSDAPLSPNVLPGSAAQPMWAQIEGDWQRLGSDGNAPSLTQQTTTLTLGGDGDIGGGWRLGAAFGYADGKLKADSRAATAETQSYTATLYGGKAFALGAGSLNVLAGTAYSWHDVDTRRQISYGSLSQTLTADYHASTTSLFAEVGYALALSPQTTIEPFAGLSWSDLRTRAFSESGGSAALSAKRQSQTLTSSLAGLRARWQVPESDIALRGLLGWRHAYGDVQPSTTLAFEGGTSFSVAGTPIARDAARVELGADLATIRNLTIALGYAGEFGGGNRQHSGTLDMRLQF
ncbi:autotransporter domain-containing protein [Achromobacter sp.]|uniref:autotransporter family protein n=1 Tax=Achromobacter sp. TaxID=134375 RepID=UPI00289B62D7|nr:autotransporter domain-containing protein [Achromobacter sp.]